MLVNSKRIESQLHCANKIGFFILKLMTKLFKIISSKYFFYTILAVNVMFVCFTKFYPSMDGPSHLYNSYLLKELLEGNQFIKDFFTVNSIIIPNWTSHFFLALFHFLFPSWISEKLLIILYISGLAISFRYLIASLNKDNILLSLLIFPFTFSFLFHLGFYNFSISFIFFFFSLAYYIQRHEKGSINFYVMLSLLLFFTYFSNVLVFCFLGLTIGFFILFFTYRKYVNSDKRSLSYGYGIRKLGLLFFAAIPSLILMGLFLNNIPFYPSSFSYSFPELFQWIIDARPFIVYNYAEEKVIVGQYSLVFLFIIIHFLYKSFRKDGFKVKLVDFMLLPLLTSLFFLFLMPDGAAAGMMSDRYCLIFFIFTLVWISARAKKSKWNYLVIVLVLVLHFDLQFRHLKVLKQLNKSTVEIYQAQEYIEKNSILLPINMSGGWLDIHFSNYIGIEKPVIILENYEADVGWFPLEWKSHNFPNIKLQGNNNLNCKVRWKTNPGGKDVRHIDYVLIYGDTNMLHEEEWACLIKLLDGNYKVKYRSPNSYVVLYEKKTGVFN